MNFFIDTKLGYWLFFFLGWGGFMGMFQYFIGDWDFLNFKAWVIMGAGAAVVATYAVWEDGREQKIIDAKGKTRRNENL